MKPEVLAVGNGANGRGQPRLRVAVDIGGTFTDGVIEDEATGTIWIDKVLTTPDDPGEGVSNVVSQLLATLERQGIARADRGVVEIVHGTTLVTNTLIERRGARTGLVMTDGTLDTLDIAREVRYDLYDLGLVLPEPLVPSDLRVGVGARHVADGSEYAPLDDAMLARLDAHVGAHDLESLAVCLLHAYANDEHEVTIREHLAQRFPALNVSISSHVAREIREYERCSTVVANAYVAPLVDRYIGALRDRFAELGIDAAIRIMLSSGGFTSTDAAVRTPILLLESGPAAGVLSAANAGAANERHHVLAFDMGGTTAKAGIVVANEPSIVHSFEAARVRRFKKGSGLPILVPSIDLIEIGAGGGSIAQRSALGTLAVGPESAGAVPGPAAYGLGGTQPTVTDANLMLGYIDPSRFLGGDMPLHVDLAAAAMQRLGDELGLSADATARGIVNVVNENMTAAARVHIAEKGFDPRTFSMVATGGAGPLHVVEVARRLRIRQVLCPIAAGAGSCLGLLAAPGRVDRSWPRPSLLEDVDWNEARDVLDALRDDARRELDSAGVASETIAWSLSADLRYEGQGHLVSVAVPDKRIEPGIASEIEALFESAYRTLYGGIVPGARPQIVTWRLTGRSPRPERRFRLARSGDLAASAEPRTHRRVFVPDDDGFAMVPVFDRYALPAGAQLEGPLILEERESTLVVALAASVRVLEDLTVAVTIHGGDDR